MAILSASGGGISDDGGLIRCWREHGYLLWTQINLFSCFIYVSVFLKWKLYFHIQENLCMNQELVIFIYFLMLKNYQKIS